MLRLHPGIEDCAVFGVPDEKWREAVAAALVLRDTTVDEIQAHCRQQLAGFKGPKEILVVSSIPRNSAQKILRQELLVLWKNSIR